MPVPFGSPHCPLGLCGPRYFHANLCSSLMRIAFTFVNHEHLFPSSSLRLSVIDDVWSSRSTHQAARVRIAGSEALPAQAR